MAQDESRLVISAEILKAYLFGKNVVPNTKQMDYLTKQVSHHLAAIPPQIKLGPSTLPGNRYGIYSTVWIAVGTEMGPYIGAVVPPSNVDWNRSNDMMWEVYTESGEISHFIDGSTVAAGQQSWISLVGMARSDSEQNLELLQIGQDIYYKAIKPIAPGTELLVWYSNDIGLYLGLPGVVPSNHGNHGNYGSNLHHPGGSTDDTQQKPSQTSRNDPGVTLPLVTPSSKETRLKCVICQRGFNSRSNLRSHMRIHTLEKPFLCKYCHRSFSQSSTLRNHTRLHTGEKPYRCMICESAYSQLAGLRAHQKSARHKPKDGDDNLIIAV